MEGGNEAYGVQVLDSQEVALVRRAQRGDAAAFGELVRLHQRRVVSVAYRLLGNTEDARDVGQDALVKAFRSLSQLDDPARFGSWLMRITTNLALNFRRSRSLRIASSIDGGGEDDDGPALESSDLGDVTPLSAEMQNAVTAALDKLPEKQRLALVLFSMEGMPQKDVAELLDCSVELVKWNVFQARKKLKELLAAHL